ncbi:MAG TPA: 30S ribosomal protein S6 [Aquificaceae bacterium]|nr:30S ribosomal protein S6 [Aquificaceae bacterium]
MPSQRHYRTVRFYETVFILKPTLSDEEVKKKVGEVKKFIESKGGEVLHLQDWGNKTLAYPINNFNHGRYFLVRTKTENPELPNELDFYLKINEDVIRWLNFQIKEKEVLKGAK